MTQRVRMFLNFCKNMERNNYNTFFCYLLILIYSLIINQYYGNLGLHTLDSTIGLSNGYRLTFGQTPFIDFWVTSGFLTDVIQSFFFKVFGFNWQAYVFHASIFNCFLPIVVFLFLRYLNLNKFNSFLYALCTATLTYPLAGVLLVDFHSLILSTIGLIIYFYSLREKNKLLITLVPLIYILAFLCKQIPAGYFIVFISIYSTVYCIQQKVTWPILYLTIGSLTSLFLFFIYLWLYGINFSSFFLQYIEFALTIFNNSKNSSLLLQLKEISKIKYFLLIFIIFITNLISAKIKEDKNDFYIIGMVSILSIIIFLTEIFTNNQNVTLGIMPLLIALISTLFIKKENIYSKAKYLLYFIITIIYLRLLIENIYYLSLLPLIYFFISKNKKISNNFSNLFLILLLIYTSFNYEKFVKVRRFNDIFSNFSNYVPGQEISEKLNYLKWKTNIVNTDNEVKMISFLLNYENIKDTKVLIVTNLQIFNFLLEKKNQSPVKYWMENKSYPSKDSPFRENFELFFKNKIKKNRINKILIVKDTDLKLEEFYWLSKCFDLNQTLNFEIEEYKLNNICS